VTRARVALVAAAVCAAACQAGRTEMFISVTTLGLGIPDDVDTIGFTVVDTIRTDFTGFQKDELVCYTGFADPAQCRALPMSVTLYPGSQAAGDPVRVLIEGKRLGTTRFKDAAVFTFSRDQSQRLDFVLYGACKDDFMCADQNKICDANRNCVELHALPLEGADLAPTADFGSRGDLSPSSAADMTSRSDMTPPGDLASAGDMSSPTDMKLPPPPPMDMMSFSDMVSFPDMVSMFDLPQPPPPPDMSMDMDMSCGGMLCMTDLGSLCGGLGQICCGSIPDCTCPSCFCDPDWHVCHQ
jgi:hypothetical protein